MQYSHPQLEKTHEAIEKSRQDTLDSIKTAAMEAARVIIDGMRFNSSDKLEVDCQKVRMDAANDILRLAGFEINRHQYFGPGESPIKIFLPEIKKLD